MAGDCGSSCPVDGGFYTYSPSVAGNAALVSAFGLLVPLVLLRGLRYRMPNFTTALMTGLLLELLGFIGRILLRSERDDRLFFTLSLLGTLLGPSFMSGAIFLVGPHILRIYGDRFTLIKPMVTCLFFYGLIISSIVVQVVGVVSVAYGFRGLRPSASAAIIAAGLGLQITALAAFIILHTWFILWLRPQRKRLDHSHSRVYQSPKFSKFLRAFELAAGTLAAYSIYRVVEMTSGLGSTLFQNETAFMVMNGAVPFVSCALLSLLHPGPAFGDAWGPTSPRRPRRRAPAPAPLQQPIGYRAHHRYDPTIKNQVTPMSQRSLRYSDPPKVASGSPGLPPNPKPLSKPPSPRAPPPALVTPPFDQRFYEGPEWRPQAPRNNLVDREALW